ncbi:nucleoside 2-deoxyribosyltransferase [Planomicrobium chinense]|uniref:nucleoside 2-deoxyribosyltransferase n=1 Tax=Planococcus chinensis TaxID=272917 RepID=UPI001CC52011|nr:nucleoside 2-deoxyribosyltransferase [Planococcus chinensis]MBZ5201739.1 nucleoside 2-deoxyribosyltransferase [Planococcus chinensis]
MEKFYVASSFKNMDAVHYLTNKLLDKGYLQTYDWTKNAQAKEKQTITLKDLMEIGQHEIQAVSDSDFVVILLPGGKGTHVELGIALGQNKKIFLYSEDGSINIAEATCTFYHLPEVEKCFGTLDELIEKIAASENPASGY